MPASQKKVIVRMLDRAWQAGYLPASSFVLEGSITLLDLSGKVQLVSLSDVKWICFVRDFHSGDMDQPERLLRKRFASRPRTEGLWLRVKLKDAEVLEGMAQNDAAFLDKDGFFLIPPDSRSNTQRIFLPRVAIVEFGVVGVVRHAAEKRFDPSGQESLFTQQN